MPTNRDERPEKKSGGGAPDAPRTDQPPEREPTHEGYFGTEEEGVREEEESGDADRGAAEDSAGGDRGILE